MDLVLCLINSLCVIFLHLSSVADGSIGVNFGMNADNLPSPPSKVVSLLTSRNIGRVRFFAPHPDSLDALRNQGIEVIQGTYNDDIPKFASDAEYAKSWVQTNIAAYAQTVKFRCIAVGNEVIPSSFSGSLLAAMQNVKAALQSLDLGNIPVTTVARMDALSNTYPPSNAIFSGSALSAMQQISPWLAQNGYPLLVTAYPYFAYASNPSQIQLSYALGNSSDVFVRDGDLAYTNLLDAMVDSFYRALGKVGERSVEVVVCESGWPSEGNSDITTTTLAQTYNQNFVNHGGKGTPMVPDIALEGYVFSLFNENKKPPGVEQHFGLFYPDMTEVYHVSFG